MSGMAELAADARAERNKRGWTQARLCEETGGVVKLRTLQNFERGDTRTHRDHLRAILRALDMEDRLDDTEDEGASEAEADNATQPELASSASELPTCKKCGKVQWPIDVTSFLNMMGIWIMTVPIERREQAMFEVTQQVWNCVRKSLQ